MPKVKGKEVVLLNDNKEARTNSSEGSAAIKRGGLIYARGVVMHSGHLGDRVPEGHSRPIRRVETCMRFSTCAQV